MCYSLIYNILKVFHGEKIVSSPTEGAIDVVADTDTKYYKQERHDYTAVGFTNVSTHQVVSIDSNGGAKLTYRAYDTEGKVRDEIVVDTPAK